MDMAFFLFAVTCRHFKIFMYVAAREVKCIRNNIVLAVIVLYSIYEVLGMAMAIVNEQDFVVSFILNSVL